MFGLALMPITYLFWPAKSKKLNIVSTIQQCNCIGCGFKYKISFDTTNWNRLANSIVLILLWLIFLYTTHYTLTQEVNYKLYDPWEELGIDRGTVLKISYYISAISFNLLY